MNEEKNIAAPPEEPGTLQEAAELLGADLEADTEPLDIVGAEEPPGGGVTERQIAAFEAEMERARAVILGEDPDAALPAAVTAEAPDDEALTPEQVAAREEEMERARAIIDGEDPDAPKDEAPGEPAEKKGFPKWAAALAAVAVAAIVAAGAAFALQPAPEPEQSPDAQEEAAGPAEPEPGKLEVTLRAEGWAKGESTPAVLKVEKAGGTAYLVATDLAEPVEFPEDDAVTQVVAIGPVNADGSFFKGALQVAEPAGAVEEVLELVPADQVTQEDADALMAALEEALSSGQIAAGDAEGLAESFSANLKAAPGVDAEKVEEQAQAAEQAAEQAAQQAASGGAQAGPAASGTRQAAAAGSAASGSASTRSSSGSGTTATTTPAAPQRVWHEGWTETVVHPAVYEYPPSYMVYVCSRCGYETQSHDDILNHTQNDGFASFHTAQRGGGSILVSEEWTEYIEHPGYWQ